MVIDLHTAATFITTLLAFGINTQSLAVGIPEGLQLASTFQFVPLVPTNVFCAEESIEINSNVDSNAVALTCFNTLRVMNYELGQYYLGNNKFLLNAKLVIN
jgi:hypothetical protein